MSHCIEAIILSSKHTGALFEHFKNVHIIALFQDLVMVPFTEELADELGPSETLSYPEFWKLCEPASRFICTASVRAPIGYVETDYFGGIGTQAAAVWAKGKLQMVPAKSARGPVSEALAVLGVRVDGTQLDAFEAVGLHRYRTNEDWIGQPTYGKC